MVSLSTFSQSSSWQVPTRVVAGAFVCLLAGVTASVAQTPTTRAEEIARARREKQARLWPERESPLVVRANHLLERGFIEGIETGEGANGWQLLLTDMRSGQGQTFGIGYRRSDLWRDRIAARVGVRGTVWGGFMVDGEAGLTQLRVAKHTFLNFYGKYERSPQMDFYGLGRDSKKENRTSYLLETVTGDLRAGYRVTPKLDIGFLGGGGGVHTGRGSRGGVPSIEEVFDAETAPGLFDDTSFAYWGGFLAYDNRDKPRGPRSGGFYAARYMRFVDVGVRRYTHRRFDLDLQQFIPYFNETRVIALMFRASLTAGETGQQVPFYLQPSIGGNHTLRGFNQYRFHDNNSFIAAVEHRWHAFAGLEMALFADAGKTVPRKKQVDLTKLNYSGGLGFRGRIGNAIVLRFDVARSREGWRLIWSLSDISRRSFW